MIKLGVDNTGALWKNKDEKFDINITKFGIDIEILEKGPETPKRTIS